MKRKKSSVKGKASTTKRMIAVMPRLDVELIHEPIAAIPIPIMKPKVLKKRKHETIPDDPTALMSVSQAAKFLGFSRNTIYSWMGNSWITARRIGRSWKFDRARLLEEAERVHENMSKRDYSKPMGLVRN